MQEILGLVRRCVEDYDMIQAGDTVAVGVSGGKDSLVTLTALARLSKFYQKPFKVAAITVETGVPGMSFDAVADYCAALGVEYIRVNVPIYEIVFLERKEKNPCSLCAKLRRGALSTAMNEHGIKTIALGHHYDDVIETILMGMLHGAQIQTMMPKLHSTNYPGMELLRPLYLVREDDIKAWRDYNGLHFIQCACKFTDTCTTCNNGQNHSKRQETKELIRELKRSNPDVEKCIFSSVENVNIDTVLAYKKDGIKLSFLDDYDSK